MTGGGQHSFGLVNIPIKLYAAVSRKTVHFNQIDSLTGARVRHKKVSAADGAEVPAEAIVKGYELASGEYVTVGDDEYDSLFFVAANGTTTRIRFKP